MVINLSNSAKKITCSLVNSKYLPKEIFNKQRIPMKYEKINTYHKLPKPIKNCAEKNILDLKI